MVAVNTGDNMVQLDTKRMEERLHGFTKGFNHVANQKIESLSQIALAPNSIQIIELLK